MSDEILPRDQNRVPAVGGVTDNSDLEIRAFRVDPTSLRLKTTATISSIIPGVGATNLGKAEDAVHASGDVGVMMLGVRQDNPDTLASASGDYTPFTADSHGGMVVSPQMYLQMDACDATTGWTVLNNDTLNLTTSTNHVFGTNSLSFDKVDGAGDTVLAGIQKTVPSVCVDKFIEHGSGFFLGSVFLPSIANVAYAWFRAGTDSTNYNEWRVTVDGLTANQWMALRGVITAPYTSAGNGWDSSTVTYIAIGVAFDDEADTLAEILVDSLFANSGLQTSADITAQVSTAVTSPNVIVRAWGNAVDTGTGNQGANTLRVTTADDDDLMLGSDFSNVLGTASLVSATPAVKVEEQGTVTVTGTIGHNITGIADGVKTVSSAGDDEALAGSTACKQVIVQAQTDNTSLIAVGATGVDATEATGTGVILYAGDSITLKCDNLADIFIDALVTGEGVRFTYLT